MSTRSSRSLKRRRKLAKRKGNIRIIINYKPGVKELINKIKDENVSLDERRNIHSQLYNEDGKLKEHLYTKKTIKL
jgi:pyruvate-formate lyase-activating enzyme